MKNKKEHLTRIQRYMDTDINELFMDPIPVGGMDIGIDTPKPQRAITSLPEGFQIRTMSDIRTLQEVAALNFTKGLRLYRGHESRDYIIESTISRLIKQKNKNCSVHDVLDSEKNGFNLFCRTIFKDEWLNNKLAKSNDDLYKMSIGRHLGLPCRLIDVTASLEVAIWFAVMNPQFYNVDGEVVLIVLDKNDVAGTNSSPFSTAKLSYAHEPFVADSLDDLPLGEQRRFIQHGHFIWVDDNSLLNEQQVIANSAFHTERFTIPWHAKLPLAIELYRDVYSGCAYQSDISRIKSAL